MPFGLRKGACLDPHIAYIARSVAEVLDALIPIPAHALHALYDAASGLPIGPIDNEDNAATVSAQLKLLEGTGTRPSFATHSWMSHGIATVS